MLEWLNRLWVDNLPVRLLDILIVWFIVYRILLYARNTRAINIIKGVGVIVGAKFLSALIGLKTIDWLLGQLISWGVLAVVILFQPELRRALETLGRSLTRARKGNVARDPVAKMRDSLESSLWYMSRRKIGALISIEKDDSLDEYIQTGIPLDAEISHPLLVNIFIPNTPLHDGAVIISGYRLMAAACYLPLSQSDSIPKELGTRHRAAIGLSEVTDAITLIVSEETGAISIAMKDHLHRDLNKEELQTLLSVYLPDKANTNVKDSGKLMQEIWRNLTQRGR